jgi:putative transposase
VVGSAACAAIVGIWAVYPVVFIDAIHVKARDGVVVNRPIYVALAATAEGTRGILGLWAGDGGEGAEHWLHILTELKNRGVQDVLMLVCDGLRGLPGAVGTVWPATLVQTCVVHLLRNSFRCAARQDWEKMAKALKRVYTAPRGRRAGAVRRVRRLLGSEVPGGGAAVGERLGGVHPLPAVRRRDPPHRVHHQRHHRDELRINGAPSVASSTADGRIGCHGSSVITAGQGSPRCPSRRVCPRSAR